MPCGFAFGTPSDEGVMRQFCELSHSPRVPRKEAEPKAMADL